MAKRRITKKRAALKKEQCTGPVNWDFARFLGLLTQGRLDEISYVCKRGHRSGNRKINLKKKRR
jgi:hypothetical protein